MGIVIAVIVVIIRDIKVIIIVKITINYKVSKYNEYI